MVNFNYSIPFSSFHNTTKLKELFSLKGTTEEESCTLQKIYGLGKVKLKVKQPGRLKKTPQI
jgi:hypothetical protein